MLNNKLSRLALGALLAAGALTSLPALAGKTVDAIKARGQLVCGVSTGLAGFSAADSQGNWSGLDVDICKASWPPTASSCSSTSVSRPSSSHQNAADNPAGPAPMIITSCMPNLDLGGYRSSDYELRRD